MFFHQHRSRFPFGWTEHSSYKHILDTHIKRRTSLLPTHHPVPSYHTLPHHFTTKAIHFNLIVQYSVLANDTRARIHTNIYLCVIHIQIHRLNCCIRYNSTLIFRIAFYTYVFETVK